MIYASAEALYEGSRPFSKIRAFPLPEHDEFDTIFNQFFDSYAFL